MLRIAAPDPGVRARLAGLAAGHPGVEIGDARGGPDAAWHLVVGAGGDVPVGTDAEVDHLWTTRLRPWADLLRAGRRAPRARHAVLVPHRAEWADAAERLLDRLRYAAPAGLLRADHVGSTAVAGLAAKPLLDLQLVLDALPAEDDAAAWATRAGLVLARGGDLYALDRHDARHRELVLVDADPGRPVNVHLHPVTSPVWREALAFRDWLRARPEARAEYERVKGGLAGEPGSPAHVDAYGRAKRDWITPAVARACRWAEG